MANRISRGLAAAVLAGLIGPAGAWAEETYPQSVAVAKTYNQSPFAYRIESRDAKNGFSIYRLTYPSPVTTPVVQNNTVPAEFYLPDGIRPGDPKRPAVICLHILDGNMELVRLTCSVLASRGVPSILFMLPYYGPRGLPRGPEAMADDPKLFLGAISQAMEDVKRTIDVLASRPEIDPQHIGITGISLGGIVAATAAGLEPRLSRVVLVLSGGNLKAIISHAHETKDLNRLINALPAADKALVERTIEEVDPLRHADGLKDRATAGKVLMINAAEDEVIPRACTEKLAKSLGISDRVVWLRGLGHYTALAELPHLLQTTADFFAEDMPPGLQVAPPPTPRNSAAQAVASLIQQATALGATEPAAGRCHLVDCDFSLSARGGKPREGHVRLVRGFQRRFRLEFRMAGVGEAAIGQEKFPWMVSGGKVLFKGVVGGDEKIDPLAFVEPRHLDRLRMVAGAAGALVLAPDVLEQVATITGEVPEKGPRTIHIAVKEKKLKGTGELVLDDDGSTPKSARFDASDLRATVTFHAWQVDTVGADALFDPPSGLEEKDVGREDLARMFSALLNFAMESVL